ncbi:ABC transporter ATP-binding protein [Pusillimonas sp. MFBS29]|uniref:ABC transporter ATP-binding protein n=1 Tax=Pusillimonas sp. MFBS29 TaxID=2886690 RepID=UPI001D11D407|nr:ABC transporter ATP-binding protein [Pusillimonas sp. MFBS29]
MLRIADLQVHYPTEHGVVEAVKSIGLEIQEGEFCTFLGPSGCGKTTTLRCIAGLEEPTKGHISLNGEDVFNSQSGVNVPTHKRDLGMVFQSYAIWPHMSVYENVAFPLEGAGMDKSEIRSQVARALEMVGLGDFAARSATQLSGGQQQRVALARAIVRNGKVLLLDEPLSNLDAKLREQMRGELRELQLKLRTTTVFVTHDQDEALAMSDRIVVMNKGAIVEQGTPTELYHTPRHLFTARFIGKADVFECEHLGAEDGMGRVRTSLGDFSVSDPHSLGKRAGYVMVRPEAVEILPEGSQGVNCVAATVIRRVFVGQKTEYEFSTAGNTKLSAVSPSYIDLPIGRQVTLQFKPERSVLLERD